MTLPPAPMVTVPCAGCVTELTVALAPSKLSLANTLTVTAVSSLVVTVSTAMSATAVTVMGTVPETAAATPSVVETVSVVEPL